MRGRPVSLTAPLALCLGLAGVMLAGPLLWPTGPNDMDFAAVLQPPSPAHPMGTDPTGRDVLARFLAGGRLSLLVGAVVTLGGLVPGTLIGVLAARAGGWIDVMLMRLMDSIAAFPPILLAMAVAIGLGGGVWSAVLGVILSTWPFFARLVRGEVLRVQAAPFVEASVAMGVSPGAVMWEHILPHTAPTLLVQCASVFGYGIITLAGLGFVGLGARIPTAEWGLMITEGMGYVLTGGWWLTLFPGLGILVSVVAANWLADRLTARIGGA